MSTNSLSKTNKLVAEMNDVLILFSDAEFFEKLKILHIDWVSRDASKLPFEFINIFNKKQYIQTIDGKCVFTARGINFLGKLLVDIEQISSGKEIDGKYIIEKLITSGKNSVTFKARHKFIGKDVVLKIIRPGSGEELIEKIQQIGQAGGEPYLVHPTDYFEISHKSLDGTPLKLKCLVFPFIQGDTLDKFLSVTKPVSPRFIYSFIKQIATALSALEKIGLQHEDLHANNILITAKERDTVLFQLIDISSGIGNPSPYSHEYSDFENFKEHLWRTLVLLQKYLPKMSIRKHLGAELFSTVECILNKSSLRFTEILSMIDKKAPYIEYNDKRTSFMEKKFGKTREPMGLLRYEEFTDHQVAMELFEPYPELLNEISQFGNAIIYGHRGSGKSTYLSALSTFPEIEKPLFAMKDKFGIFFACRQGEFRQFAPPLIAITPQNILFIKHIIVLKIIRRVIGVLNAAIKRDKLIATDNISELLNFINQYISEGASYNYEETIISPLENIHTSMLRDEINEIDNLFASQINLKVSELLNEKILINFFELIRSVFPGLGNTKFYILFDDAGEPNVSEVTQWVINDIIRCINSAYCVKLSAERYSYEFKDTRKKVLEESHDYSSFDISARLSLGSGFHPERTKLKDYFKKIIEKRLSHLEYTSFDITHYLGDNLIETDELVKKLSESKKDAYYCGWNIIWELCNRTTRSLLELVSHILIAGSVTSESAPSIISKLIQHQTIKAFSEKKLKSLAFIPGKIEIQRTSYGLGIKIYEFAAAFGKISKEYLRKTKASRPGRQRFDERIAIERDDSHPLSKEAEVLLKYLIRFAVLDDVQLVVSRDDRLKKPIYTLNRIFCPAFAISYRRDTHLRLGKDKFEMFLLDPKRFVDKGTAFLKKRIIPKQEKLDLFGRIDG